jgi:hypothetical protein
MTNRQLDRTYQRQVQPPNVWIGATPRQHAALKFIRIRRRSPAEIEPPPHRQDMRSSLKRGWMWSDAEWSGVRPDKIHYPIYTRKRGR